MTNQPCHTEALAEVSTQNTKNGLLNIEFVDFSLSLKMTAVVWIFLLRLRLATCLVATLKMTDV